MLQLKFKTQINVALTAKYLHFYFFDIKKKNLVLSSSNLSTDLSAEGALQTCCWKHGSTH